MSVIIVSYNTKYILDQCIASLYSSKIKSDFEIIVIDNASQDGSVENLEQKYPEVRIIKKPYKQSLRYCQLEARIARDEYLLLLNSNTIVYDVNLEKIVQFMTGLDKSIICVGPKILSSDKTL